MFLDYFYGIVINTYIEDHACNGLYWLIFDINLGQIFPAVLEKNRLKNRRKTGKRKA